MFLNYFKGIFFTRVVRISPSRSLVNRLIWNARAFESPADFAISFAYCQKIWSRIVFTAAGGMVMFLSWRPADKSIASPLLPESRGIMASPKSDDAAGTPKTGLLFVSACQSPFGKRSALQMLLIMTSPFTT